MFLIKDLYYSHVAGIKNRKTKELITNDPKEVVKMLGDLYGGKLDRGTTNNFQALHEWLKANASSAEYRSVIGAYLKILDRTKSVKIGEDHCGYIPRELEEVWIGRQDELKLSGKYICKDTNPAIWEHIYGGR